MFTSSISSFRHARTRPVAGVRRVARRVGVAVTAAAFVAALPSPASASPTLTEPATVSNVESVAPNALIDTLGTTGEALVPDALTRAGSGKGHKHKHDGKGHKHKGHKGGKDKPKPQPAPSRGSRVMGVASAQAGDPYVYGAAGPNAFDCSGLTSFVYRVAAGKSLPHSSSAQAGATQRISRADARPGDLVFFTGSGGVYHVAIFAGGNTIIHASKPGVPVGRAQIWTSSIFFGRVR